MNTLIANEKKAAVKTNNKRLPIKLPPKKNLIKHLIKKSYLNDKEVFGKVPLKIPSTFSIFRKMQIGFTMKYD